MGQALNTGAANAAPTRRALLGGAGIIAVMATAPAIAATVHPASQIEAYRLEYRAVFDALNASPNWDDDCPVVAAHCDRLKRLEALICETPSATRADAEAKLRYACEIAEDGMVLDADDAADLMRDVAKHLIAVGR